MTVLRYLHAAQGTDDMFRRTSGPARRRSSMQPTTLLGRTRICDHHSLHCCCSLVFVRPEAQIHVQHREHIDVVQHIFPTSVGCVSSKTHNTHRRHTRDGVVGIRPLNKIKQSTYYGGMLSEWLRAGSTSEQRAGRPGTHHPRASCGEAWAQSNLRSSCKRYKTSYSRRVYTPFSGFLGGLYGCSAFTA